MYKKFIPFVVSLALFMEALDSTILNTAIPAMSKSLQVNPIDLKIALISYLLTLAIFMPISGWVGDKFGVKRIFLWASGLFTISSIWCGFSHNLTELVLARSLQGLGGSLTLPVGRLIMLRSFPRNEMIQKMNQVIMVSAFGVMAGPVLGGYITHYLSWPWIFWVNIPVGILVIVLGLKWLQPAKPLTVPPLDKLGFILFGVSLASFTFGLSAFTESAISTLLAITIIISAGVIFGIYFWHSHNSAHPVVSTDLLKIRSFRVSTLGNLLTRLSFGGLPFLVPLLLQVALGYTAQIAGLLLAPIAIAILTVKPLSRIMLFKLGFRRYLVSNTMLIGLVLMSFIFIGAHTPLWVIAVLTFIYGAVTTLQYGAMGSLAFADIAVEKLSAATSITSTVQQLSQSFGVAVSALVIHMFSELLHNKAIVLIPSIFHWTFFVLGLLTILSTGVFLGLKRCDGYQMLHKAR